MAETGTKLTHLPLPASTDYLFNNICNLVLTFLIKYFKVLWCLCSIFLCWSQLDSGCVCVCVKIWGCS